MKYCISTSAILSDSASPRPTQLPTYQSLFSETMKESANLFRVWLHYHTSANIFTNPRRWKHSFSNSLKINEWQQNAKSKSKVTLSLIFSVSKAKLRESILFLYFFFNLRFSATIIKFIHVQFSPPTLIVPGLFRYLGLEEQMMWDRTGFFFYEKRLLLPLLSLSWSERAASCHRHGSVTGRYTEWEKQRV